MNFARYVARRIDEEGVSGGAGYQPPELADPELQKLLQDALWSVKRNESGWDEMFGQVHGIDGDAGWRFQSHGMAKGSYAWQFKSLVDILTKGVVPNLHSINLAFPPDKRGASAGLGATGPYGDGMAILVSEVDRPLKEKLGSVILSEPLAVSGGAAVLGRKFPAVKFIPCDKAAAYYWQFKPKAGGTSGTTPGLDGNRFSITGYLKGKGVRAEDIAVDPSRAGNQLFARNRQTGKSVAISTSEQLPDIERKLKTVFQF